MSDFFDAARNCWKLERAERASVVVDGENYYRHVRSAMLKAKKRIIMLGWDFDTRIKMHDTNGEPEGPLEVGDFIEWLVKRTPELQVYILRWDTGAIKSIFRGKMIFTLAKWMVHPRIHLKLDGKHPVGAAHHQKIIVIDDDTAFCGGIDITDNRWDTREHLKSNKFRKQPNGQDHGPWHDASMALQGPVAKALSEFVENRWDHAIGTDLAEPAQKNDCWPDTLDTQFANVDVAIARTFPEMDDQKAVNEIENLYLDLIASAKKYIYAESQYFASRKIASAIGKRLDETNGPEIVIINPSSSDGWLEPEFMDTKRKQLFTALRKRDHENRLRFYHPINEAGEDIYVHAKIVIVDDRFLRVGSSNMNNRSLGFDTECDVAIDAGKGRETDAHRSIRTVRNDLLAEHLGSKPEEIEALFDRTGSLIETIELSRNSGRTLRDYQVPDLNAVEDWLSENDVFDPEDADDNFAVFS